MPDDQKGIIFTGIQQLLQQFIATSPPPAAPEWPRLPPGVIERCVGSVSALKGVRPLECWRHGVLLTSTPSGEAEGAATALLELTSTELKVEVRGSTEVDAQVLQQVLAPLVEAVEHVLLEYPGFTVSCR